MIFSPGHLLFWGAERNGRDFILQGPLLVWIRKSQTDRFEILLLGKAETISRFVIKAGLEMWLSISDSILGLLLVYFLIVLKTKQANTCESLRTDPGRTDQHNISYYYYCKNSAFGLTSDKHPDFPLFSYPHIFPTKERRCLNHNHIHQKITRS